MMQDSVESTDQAEALVNTLQIEGASLSDANLSSLSSSDLEQLADLQAELDSINASEIETTVERIAVKQMLDGDIVETEIGGEEVIIESEELEQCGSPDEILPHYKDEEDDVEEHISVEPIVKIEPKEAAPPPLRPLTIAPKPTKVQQMALKTAAVVNQGSQQIVLIQSPGGTTSTVNVGGQQIKLMSAQGQSVTIPNLQNVQLSKSSSTGQMVQLRAVPKGTIVSDSNSAITSASATGTQQQFKGAIKKIIPQNKNILAKVIMGGQQQVVQIAGNAQTANEGNNSQSQQIKLVTSMSSGNLPANAKTITLAQAQQMGLITGSKVQQLVPQSPTKQTLIVNKPLGTKTIKVVPQIKSPTKILPAPIQASKITKPGLQRVIIKQGNQLKAVTTTSGTSSNTGATNINQVIRLPAGQTLGNAASTGQIHQINVPGKGVQYIRFMPASSASSSIIQTNTSNNTIISSTSTSAPTVTFSTQNQIKQVQKAQVVPVAGISVNRLAGNKIVGSVSTSNTSQNIIKVLPISGASSRPVAPKPITTQRVLIPASSSQTRSVQQITAIPASALSQIQGTIIPSGNNVSQIVMLPAQYVQQISQNQSIAGSSSAVAQQSVVVSAASKSTIHTLNVNNKQSTVQKTIKLSPTTLVQAKEAASSVTNTTNSSNNSNNMNNTQDLLPSSPESTNFSRPLEPNGIRPRKPCNCTKSLCLKLYCDCFANGEFCHLCNCMNCYNNLDHEEDRSRAIRNCLERNPNAFRPKIGKGKDSGESSVRKHTKGCNCKRSGCLKNYCECYEAKIACSSNCKCIGCRNIEDSMEKKNVRPLTLAAMMPDTQLQVVPTTKSKHNVLPLQHDVTMFRPLISNANTKAPSTYMTNEVIEATTQCLIAQAEEAERNMLSDELAKRMILEEFGRCLVEIIECSKSAASTANT